MKPLVVVTAILVLGATAMAQLPLPEKLPANPDLPDPLVLMNGTKVASKDDWLAKRKPELKDLFQNYMYGYLPTKPANLSFRVDRIDKNALGGKATLKEITISFGPPETPKVHLLLVIPNKRSGPAPVFVGLNFHGNHAALGDPKIALPTTWVPARGKGAVNSRATDAGRGSENDTWSIEQTIDAGYAVATVYSGDIEPDRTDKREGVQAHIHSDKPAEHDWGTIAAWAWGISRVIDYLVTDGDIDAGRIIVFGHSRMGKTALLASVFDERVALAIPHQAGCGGTGPSRTHNPKSETVKRINTSFPHWFTPTFSKFNDAVEKIPFDQHSLVALMAPRPVLYSNATDDQWANPDGQFDMLVAADPVYKLLGSEGLAVKARPAVGTLVTSPLGYFIRNGPHSTTPDDWRIFVQFANARLKK
jgi:dienelactone hydrolase